MMKVNMYTFSDLPFKRAYVDRDVLKLWNFKVKFEVPADLLEFHSDNGYDLLLIDENNVVLYIPICDVDELWEYYEEKACGIETYDDDEEEEEEEEDLGPIEPAPEPLTAEKVLEGLQKILNASVKEL